MVLFALMCSEKKFWDIYGSAIFVNEMVDLFGTNV